MTSSPEPLESSPIATISSTASARALNTLSREQYKSAARALETTWTRSIYAVGTWHALSLCLMNNYAIMLIKLGRHGKAKSLLQRAVAEMELRLPPRHPEYYFALCSLATLYYIQGHKARGDSTIAKCEAHTDKSTPSTIRSCLDAAHLARSTQEDTLKFKDVSQLAYTQETFDETQLFIEPLGSQRRQSRPVLMRFLSLSNLREQGARTTELDSHGTWRQWIPGKRRSLAHNWTILPENPEHISNVNIHNNGSKRRTVVDSKSKRRAIVRWADQVAINEEDSRVSGTRRGSRSEELDNESDNAHCFELPVQPAAVELPTSHHICLADRMDQEAKALTPIPDLQGVGGSLTTAAYRPTLTDNVAAAGVVLPLLSSNPSSKPGDNELEIEERAMAYRPSESNGSTALGQWANIVLESCTIKEELEDHRLEAQPFSDRVQLSAANLERGSLESRTSLCKISVSKPNTTYAISVSSSTPVRSPESFHSAAADPTRDESTISPTSSTEDRIVTSFNSKPSADSSDKTINRSKRSTLRYAQSIYSSISKPPPTDRSSGIIPNRLLRAEILMRASTGKLIVSHEIEILLDTGCTDLDVVSAEYCECWGHPVVQAPERLQDAYISAMGCPVNIQGIAKICLRWYGPSGTKTLVREFAVVEDYPQDMSLGNRTITRFNLLRESAGLMLPLLLAPRSKEDKERDREQTRAAKAIAKEEEDQRLKERLKRWNTAPDSPFGSTSSSDLTASSDTASRTATTSRSGGQSQDSSQGTSLTSDPVLSYRPASAGSADHIYENPHQKACMPLSEEASVCME